jgi:ribosomal protein L13
MKMKNLANRITIKIERKGDVKVNHGYFERSGDNVHAIAIDLRALTHPRSPSKKVMKAVRKMVHEKLKERGKE